MQKPKHSGAEANLQPLPHDKTPVKYGSYNNAVISNIISSRGDLQDLCSGVNTAAPLTDKREAHPLKAAQRSFN